MVNNILELTNLSLPFAFKNLSISFQDNTFITISGPNNCGKTTLIKVLGGINITNNNVFLFSNELAAYKQSELTKIMCTIIPERIEFNFPTLEDELNYLVYKNYIRKNDINPNNILKSLGLTKILKKELNKISINDQIKCILALAMIKKVKIILLDDILKNFSNNDRKKIINILLEYKKREKTMIIMTISNLEDSLYSDYLYIIDNEKIILKGAPLDVLEKDNILNKLGLELPFMLDLSVKLRDYDLISALELDQERLVDKLWN